MSLLFNLLHVFIFFIKKIVIAIPNYSYLKKFYEVFKCRNATFLNVETQHLMKQTVLIKYIKKDSYGMI